MDRKRGKTLVKCRECGLEFLKRNDSIKNWKGMCRPCSSRITFTPEVIAAGIEASKKVKRDSAALSERAKKMWNTPGFREKHKSAIDSKRPRGERHYLWSGGGNICKMCGKKIPGRGKADRCRECYGKSLVGKKRPKYIGDKISLVKRKPFAEIKTSQKQIRMKRREYIFWRKAVFLRDSYTCRECGSTENIECHHIKEVCSFPELAFDIDNGLTLCHSCHVKTENYGISSYNNIYKKYKENQ